MGRIMPEQFILNPIKFIQTNKIEGLRLKFKRLSNENIKFIPVCQYNPDEISEESANSFCEVFTKPPFLQERIYNIPGAMHLLEALNRLDSAELSMHKTSLIEELFKKNYNLSSFVAKARGFSVNVPLQRGRQVPGRLRCIYANDEEGILDTVCWWHVPGCSKRDVNAVFYFLSGPGFISSEFPNDLKKMGFNPKSFSFRIDHNEKSPLKSGLE